MTVHQSLTQKEKQNITHLSQEASKVLKLLDEIEEFTINIGEKMMDEMKSKSQNIHIDLNDSNI